MDLHLELAGCLLIALAVAHLGFPRYFRWSQELRPLSPINRQIMQVHTLFIALTVLLMGVLCLTCPGDLAGTRLGHRVSCGLGVFWGIRLVIQFVGYSPALWRGKAFETVAHIAFSLLWLYLTTVFLVVAGGG